jgi:hypothetical protein
MDDKIRIRRGPTGDANSMTETILAENISDKANLKHQLIDTTTLSGSGTTVALPIFKIQDKEELEVPDRWTIVKTRSDYVGTICGLIIGHPVFGIIGTVASGGTQPFIGAVLPPVVTPATLTFQDSSGTNNTPPKFGDKITVVGTGVTITEVVTHPTCNATSCYIYTDVGDLVSSAPVTSNTASFSVPVTTGSSYYIVVDKDGASYVRTYKNPATWPVTNDHFSSTCGIWWNVSAWQTDSIAYTIKTIKSSTVVSTPTVSDWSIVRVLQPNNTYDEQFLDNQFEGGWGGAGGTWDAVNHMLTTAGVTIFTSAPIYMNNANITKAKMNVTYSGGEPWVWAMSNDGTNYPACTLNTDANFISTGGTLSYRFASFTPGTITNISIEFSTV